MSYRMAALADERLMACPGLVYGGRHAAAFLELLAAAAAAAAAAWAWVVPSDLGGFPLVSAGQHQFMDGFAMGEPETVDVA